MRQILIALLLLCSYAFGAPYSGHSHSSKSSSSKPAKAKKVKTPKAPKAGKTVHVRGYTRNDGTYVAPYDRSAPGTGATSPGSASVVPYRKNYAPTGFALDSSVQINSHGKIKRSAAAKSAFEHQQPCPSTGKSTGRCPGYIVDHVNPLECGGADSPSNMQWQTTAEAKAKDKTERNCRI